jgi:pantothenate kinase
MLNVVVTDPPRRTQSSFLSAAFFCYNTNHMKLVIGIIGPPLAGKETCASRA